MTTTYRQRCTECERRRSTVPHLTATRTAGGNYRRPPRQYSSTICLPCAVDLLDRAPLYSDPLLGVGRWHGSSLRAAVERHRWAELRAWCSERGVEHDDDGPIEHVDAEAFTAHWAALTAEPV